jgi:hypothetical protein
VAFAKLLRLRETAPAKAAALQRKLESEADRVWSDAKLKDSSRHWFEISHLTYLKAIEKLIQEATP